MKFSLIKISAAGNRFLIADKRWLGDPLPEKLRPYAVEAGAAFESFDKLSGAAFSDRNRFLAKTLSGKETSPADGLIVLDSLAAALECAFYNRDGSAAEMCGNAACCLAFYMDAIDAPKSSFRLGKEMVQTARNPAAEDTRLLWGVTLGSKPLLQGDFPFLFQGRERFYTFISPGVPHAVVKWDFAPFEPFSGGMLSAAKALRHKNPLNEGAGMNVSFFQILESQNQENQNQENQKPENQSKPIRNQTDRNQTNWSRDSQARGQSPPQKNREAKTVSGNKPKNKELKAITFERGVEGWTAACGTGALAAACVFAEKHSSKKLDRVFVNMPGGKLMIRQPFSSGARAEEKFSFQSAPSLFSPVEWGFALSNMRQ